MLNLTRSEVIFWGANISDQMFFIVEIREEGKEKQEGEKNGKVGRPKRLAVWGRKGPNARKKT